MFILIIIITTWVIDLALIIINIAVYWSLMIKHI